MKLFFPLAIAILVGLWAFGSMAMSPKTLIDTIVMPRAALVDWRTTLFSHQREKSKQKKWGKLR